jgi:nitronate monooxygenase
MDRALTREIRRARELSDGIIGVNIMVAQSNFSQAATCAMEEGIDLIISGAGLPLRLPGLKKEGCKTKLVPIVSSGRAAGILCKRWTQSYDYLPDAFVVEGPMAGGHLGFKPEEIFDPAFALEKLVPDVIEAVKPYEEKYGRGIPIIAAGGVYTGEDICKFLEMGASGIQMATRFVGTHECDAHMPFKQAYIDCKEEDIVIVESPLGLPGRCIGGPFTESIKRGEKHPFKCPFHRIITCKGQESPYCIAYCLANAKVGRLDKGYAFCGANAYRVNEIVSVKELIQTLEVEYKEACRQPAS